MTTPGTLTQDDWVAIAELGARYAHAMDAKNAEAYAACFAPDGVLVSMRGGRAEGRAAIQASVQTIFDNWETGFRHFPGPPVLGGNAQRCTVRSYSQVLRRDPERRTIIEMVMDYYDTCVKLDGQWLLAERINTLAFGDLPT